MRSSLLIAIALLSVGSLPHCMRVTGGIEIDVAYHPEATPAQIRTDMEYRVALERALIVLGKVELIRCDNFVVDLWELVAPARARAHLGDTPTSLGVPLIIDLMESAGTPRFAGTMKPPPGRYCGIRVLGMPADPDAVGLTDENLDMMQHSVLITGHVVDTTSGEEMPLIARIWEVLQLRDAIRPAAGFRRPGSRKASPFRSITRSGSMALILHCKTQTRCNNR